MRELQFSESRRIAVTQDEQVRRLFSQLSSGISLRLASLKTGMDEKTARKYWKAGRMPSELSERHDWRTRVDPFASVWEVVGKQLTENPGLQAKVLFAWLQGEHPGQFQDGQLRTFQRGVRRWRATAGPDKEVFFSQVHEAGRLCASDFSHMTNLNVTIARQQFDHMVYHFVLTHSNWEWANVCFSESFESLSEGLQGAMWALGGVPLRHRTDRLSAAVNNLSETREFTSRYQSLMDHYGLEKERIQARKAHENGDVETSHRHFKDAVDQALMLRGSRDFESRAGYSKFLDDLLQRRNVNRETRTKSERALLRPLPARRYESWRRMSARVGLGSTLKVDRNTYSVPSRLIGETVDVRLCVEDIEVWYGGVLMERLPRLRGHGQEKINYRHVIGWLVRKPGAFERYRYREDLFPTSRFRMAYDALREYVPARAVQEYLAIVEMAALDGETLVDDALRLLLDSEEKLTAKAVEQFVRTQERVPEATAVRVEELELSCFDQLLEESEVWCGSSQGSESDVVGSLARVAFASVP
jgi:hypothetical protein